ncbi:cell division protein SepF [Candidatus Aenigmatarchaeota archaeon]
MGLKNIFNRENEGLSPDEDYIELDFEEEQTSKRVMIHVEKMEDFGDADRVLKKVREGAILLVKIKELRNKDIAELKRSIEKLRKTCMAINGDIAGIGEDWLVLTPNYARVHRESE